MCLTCHPGFLQLWGRLCVPVFTWLQHRKILALPEDSEWPQSHILSQVLSLFKEHHVSASLFFPSGLLKTLVLSRRLDYSVLWIRALKCHPSYCISSCSSCELSQISGKEEAIQHIMKPCVFSKAFKSYCGLTLTLNYWINFSYSLIFPYTLFEKSVNLLWISLSFFNLNASRIWPSCEIPAHISKRILSPFLYTPVKGVSDLRI